MYKIWHPFLSSKDNFTIIFQVKNMREFPDYSMRSGFSGNSLGQDRAETLGNPRQMEFVEQTNEEEEDA